MKKVYIHAMSKSALRKELKSEDSLLVTEYNYFNPDGYEVVHDLLRMDQDVIVAIYKNEEGPPQPVLWCTYDFKTKTLL